jgi:hypothetical protein
VRGGPGAPACLVSHGHPWESGLVEEDAWTQCSAWGALWLDALGRGGRLESSHHLRPSQCWPREGDGHSPCWTSLVTICLCACIGKGQRCCVLPTIALESGY